MVLLSRWKTTQTLDFGRRLVAVLVFVASIATACAGKKDELAAPPPTAAPTVPTTLPPPPPPTAPAAPVWNREACVVQIQSGESLGAVANRVGGVSVAELQKENRLSSEMVLHPGDELDVCIGNNLDDLTGASNLAPDTQSAIRQQTKLNELFEPYSIAPLTVDGQPGSLTRQLLCAARMGLGLPVSSWYMAPGSQEEATLMAATSLSIPAGAATWGSRWILVDQTCQVIFTGEGTDKIVDIFATSTGIDEFPTRNVEALMAYRYDPAADTDGWHDSETFPSPDDAAGSGNMYRPLYYNKGQAIHGARYIPALPRSHGCARTFPQDQDKILKWLGLDDVTSPVWDAAKLNVVVTVQGRYRPPK